MAQPATRIKKSPVTGLLDWLDERTGWRAMMSHLLDEPIRGGARWAYVFGSILLFIFGLQVVTGIVLSLYYAPSADHAHISVAYIQKVVPGGALLRGIHHHGASVMVIFAIIHLAQVYLFGAYKNKRELLWGTGGLMLLIILGFAFTGYLLRWDQEAYFGTKVGTSIAGEIPVVGPVQQRVMLGGSDLSTLTLSRFFTVHVFLLPLALAGLVGLHLFLFRRSGPAGPYHNRAEGVVDRFYPKQLFKDSVAMLLVFAGLVFITLKWPAELGPEADPTSDYLARPPWYFMPLFQLLKYFPGELAIIPTVVLPGMIFALLFLLPFFDKSAERHPRKRPVATAMLALILLGALGLIAVAKYQDRTNPEFKDKMAQQEAEAHAYLAAPFEPQQLGSVTPPAKTAAGEVAAAPEVYVLHCGICHGDKGEGGDDAPGLVDLTSKPNRTKEDLLKILDDARAYGIKKPMPQSFPKLSAEEKQLIVDWMVQLKAK